MKKNNESMSKFDKSVEMAKIQIEKTILDDAKIFNSVFLYNNVEDCITDLGGDWYYNAMLSAGYSGTTAKRKWLNYDLDKLISKLAPWYQTELLPKLCKSFKNENITINWYRKFEDIKNKINISFVYHRICKIVSLKKGKYNFSLAKVEPEDQTKAEALLNKLIDMGIYEYIGTMYELEEELK